MALAVAKRPLRPPPASTSPASLRCAGEEGPYALSNLSFRRRPNSSRVSSRARSAP
jgi:hypothetical protein